MSNRMIRIAVDAMGGDHYPGVLIEGGIAALQVFPDIEIVLVGDEAVIGEGLRSFSESGETDKERRGAYHHVRNRLHTVHASEIIGMDESPARSIRTKKDSSIAVANKLCRSRDVEAVISAGNTGAAMAASLLYMGRLTGVHRPAIMTMFPSMKNAVAIIDIGANTDCKPEHLFQFGTMASIYVSYVFGCERPRVGLLNIGEERSKGNELTEGAYALFEKSSLNFIGNVEGRDIFKGDVDVVVCDGFVGNVLLKFGESVFGFVTHALKKNIKHNFLRLMGAYLMKPAFRDVKKQMSDEDYGGAPLLGVDGVSIICHGNSTPLAIRNAVSVARQFVLEGLNEQIKREFASTT